jgi:hypothetical protein
VPDQLADLQGHQVGQLLAALARQLCGSPYERCPLVHQPQAPGLERLVRGFDRVVDGLRTHRRKFAHNLVGVRVHRGDRAKTSRYGLGHDGLLSFNREPLPDEQ